MFCNFICELTYESHYRQLFAFVLFFDHSRGSHRVHRLVQLVQQPAWPEQQRAETDIQPVVTTLQYNSYVTFLRRA